ncbi:MAG TPA: xanthine dehydrogenase family protein molybdopterin-binding subunit [Hyphomicrobiaceae bacterium]|nr:xanthine dehydrogenase family protein molybdopterin-binding subunit [Hyphomicrobiaceae bacterium]
MTTNEAKRVRREDERMVTGRGRYVADIMMPDMAYGVVVRSSLPHAELRGIDTAAAKAAPGVLAVLTAADLAADGITEISPVVEQKRPDGSKAPEARRPVLARDRVRFVGEPIAFVVATSLRAAQDAAELVVPDYGDLPAVVTTAQARAPGAPAIWPAAPDNVALYWTRGDLGAADKVIAGAKHVARLKSHVTRVNANSIEPRGALGYVDSAGRLVLHVSNQGPHGLKGSLAPLLKVTPDKLRIVVGDVGGSFGMKSGVYNEDVLVLAAARRLGRPVRWISDRLEGFLSDEHGRDVGIEATLALDGEGQFLALKINCEINLGCFLTGRSMGLLNNIGGISGVYRTPIVAAEITGVLTNTQVTAPYRGAGRPEATYAVERVIDIAARQMGIDPFELRWRNLVQPESMPYATGFIFTYDCGNFPRNMTEAARLADRSGFEARRADAKSRGKLLGLGIANPVEVAGGPFLKPGKDAAMLSIAGDGTVTVTAGALSTGQGIETTFVELAASKLGLPASQITYRQGDTDAIGHGRGSGGSSALCVGGTATLQALDAVIEKAKVVASDMLETAAGDLRFADGRFTVVGTDRSVALGDVARRAADKGEPLAAGAEFQPTKVTFPNGCHLCEVEVDPVTGETEIKRYTVVEDVGRVMNPTLMKGQIHGGVAQGVGQALFERMSYDPESGQLMTASFMDYTMPRADDLSAITVGTNEVPTAVNPLGAKGVGEAGTVGSMVAAVNAVCDALAPLGVNHIEMPLTPDRVWVAIQGATLA